jgi:hypothetical protein
MSNALSISNLKRLISLNFYAEFIIILEFFVVNCAIMVPNSFSIFMNSFLYFIVLLNNIINLGI